MAGFVKLHSSMLRSTIWFARPDREIFITALLMAEPRELPEVAQLHHDSLDETGFVLPAGWYGFCEASGPGIVHSAGVDMAEGMVALKRLSSPEKESRSQAFDGRRMIRVNGGWVILNYMTYRERDTTSTERSRRWREKKKNERCKKRDATPSHHHGDVAQPSRATENVSGTVVGTQAEAEAEAYKVKVKTTVDLAVDSEPEKIPDSIREIFEHYRTHHPRSHPRPSSKSREWRAIKARLDEGVDNKTLKAAIDGMHMTPHNLGCNDRGQKYLGLELCMRSGDQVTRFAEITATGPPRRETHDERVMREIEEHNARLDKSDASEDGGDDERARKNPDLVFDADFGLGPYLPAGKS